MEFINKKIYSSTLAVRFFELAVQYHHSTNLLKQADCLYPKVYLERHTLELLLKAYILSKIPKTFIVFTDKKRFSVSYGQMVIKLNEHKLVNLYNNVFQLDDALLRDFENPSVIMKEVKKWMNYDSDNERYKYPISLTGTLSRRNSNPVPVIIDDVIPEIKRKSRSYFVIEDSMSKHVLNVKKIDLKVENYSKFLNEQIKQLFAILETSIIK